MLSKQYREKYRDALKLQRWPLVDTRKMEIEKKEKARQARLRRLYGLKDDEQLKTYFIHNFINNTYIYIHKRWNYS